MIDAKLLEILCCPETYQKVRVVEANELSEINQKIAQGIMKRRSGEIEKNALEAALIREDGQVAYAVRNNIPIMLIEESLELASSS